MTKVSVFGQEATESKQLKPIQFVKRIESFGSITPTQLEPSCWDNLMLYRGSDGPTSFDIILAFDNKEGERAIFLGHWNDGVV